MNGVCQPNTVRCAAESNLLPAHPSSARDRNAYPAWHGRIVSAIRTPPKPKPGRHVVRIFDVGQASRAGATPAARRSGNIAACSGRFIR